MHNMTQNQATAHKTKQNRKHEISAAFSSQIKQMLTAHWMALRLSFRNLAQTPMSTLMTIIAIGIALSLPLGLHALLKNIQNLSSHFEFQGSITVYLDSNIPQPEILALETKIRNQYPQIASTQYISPDRALEDFRAQVDIEGILALLPKNPLTGMIVLQLDPEQTPYQEALRIKQALGNTPYIKMVDLDYEWVEKLHAFLRLGRVLSNCLGLLIGFGVVLIIGNIIRLSLEKHKDELEVLNLIGATKSFIRRPFLYRGLFFGALGAIIGAMIISLATLMLQPPAQTLSTLYGGLLAIEPLSLMECAALCFYSCILGWLGAMLAFYQQHQSIS